MISFYRVKERKPPARGGFTPSKRVVLFDALRQIGAARLKRKGVSPSADGDLRLCLKNSCGSGGFPKENGGGSRQDRVEACCRQAELSEKG